MRMMLRFTMPVETGNQAAKDGTMGRTIDALLEQLNPEAAYFMVEDGERAGIVFFDAAEPAQLPTIAEPLFLNLDAAVEFVPVLNADDLRKGLAQVSP